MRRVGRWAGCLVSLLLLEVAYLLVLFVLVCGSLGLLITAVPATPDWAVWAFIFLFVFMAVLGSAVVGIAVLASVSRRATASQSRRGDGAVRRIRNATTDNLRRTSDTFLDYIEQETRR